MTRNGGRTSVAVLSSLKIQHELNESALQSGPGTHVDGETSARDLGRSIKIQNPELHAYFPVRTRFEGKLARATDATDLHVCRLVLTHGDTLVRHVGDRQQQTAQARFDFLLPFLFDLDGVGCLSQSRPKGLSFVLFLFLEQLTDALRLQVVFMSHLAHSGLELFPSLVEPLDLGKIDFGSAVIETLDDKVKVVDNKAQIQHGITCYRPAVGKERAHMRISLFKPGRL